MQEELEKMSNISILDLKDYIRDLHVTKITQLKRDEDGFLIEEEKEEDSETLRTQ
jgi:hypothetical protein